MGVSTHLVPVPYTRIPRHSPYVTLQQQQMHDEMGWGQDKADNDITSSWPRNWPRHRARLAVLRCPTTARKHLRVRDHPHRVLRRAAT